MNPPKNCQKLLRPEAEKWRPQQKFTLRPEAEKWRKKKIIQEAENSEPQKRNIAISTQSCCSGYYILLSQLTWTNRSNHLQNSKNTLKMQDEKKKIYWKKENMR